MGIGAEISVGLQLKLAFPRLLALQAEQWPENVAHIPGEVAGCYASDAGRGTCCIKPAVDFLSDVPRFYQNTCFPHTYMYLCRYVVSRVQEQED